MMEKEKINNWEDCKLDDICVRIVDGSHNPPKPQSSGFSMLSAKDVFDNKIDFSSPRFLDKASFIEENRRTDIKPGDVLLTIVATIGRTAVVPQNAPNFTLQRSVAVIKTLINSYYLCYYFQSQFFQNQLRENAKGTAQKGVYLKTLSNLVVRIAPINEQYRIVEKLDELLSELEKGKEQLQTSLEQLKVYRQSILKHAFEGKLTKNESDLQKVNFHSIIKLVSGNTPKGVEKATNSGTIPFYRVSDMNLEGNEVEMRTSNVLLSVAEKEKLKIKTYPKGTVIFPKRGGAILTNKKRILGEDASFDLNLMGALPNEKVNSKYLFYWFVFLDLSKICDGSNVPQINYKNFDSIEFNYFELNIQIKIVELIELQLSICDEMEISIHSNLIQSDSLRSTILQKAFEGKLVEQDPTDEPGSVLLDRIKKEREEYLKAEKERKKTDKPLHIKSRKMAEELKRIIEILKESKEPVSAKTLWQSSTHKDDIDDFYAALKRHIEAGEIVEVLPRKGRESLLKLAVSK